MNGFSMQNIAAPTHEIKRCLNFILLLILTIYYTKVTMMGRAFIFWYQFDISLCLANFKTSDIGNFHLADGPLPFDCSNFSFPDSISLWRCFSPPTIETACSFDTNSIEVAAMMLSNICAFASCSVIGLFDIDLIIDY